MNGNENRMEPLAPDEKMEITDEKLENVAGGVSTDGRYITNSNGACSDCGYPLIMKAKTRGGYKYWYCQSCKKYSEHKVEA
ncbi:MAG: hypothetical protein LUD16_02665 [Lachnospiraceae bacterium]|nr:hypothetical protein [Lachnospiraceae bacterium]